MIVGILLVQAVAFAVLSGIVASNKNRDPLGWGVLGFLFGLFAFLAALVVGEVEEEEKRFSFQKSQSSTKGQSSSKEKRKQPNIEEFDPDEHEKKCPRCAEYIKLEALVCRFCGHEFSEEEVERQIEEKRQEYVGNSSSDEKGGEWECRCGAVNGTEHDLCPECGRSPDAVI